MASTCPHCGAAPPDFQTNICPACGTVLAGAVSNVTASPPALPGPETAFTEEARRPIAPPPEADLPSIVRPPPPPPACPAWLLIILSGLLCGFHTVWASAGGVTGRLSSHMTEAYVGGGLGVLIGLALAVDHWRFQRKLRQLPGVPDDAETPADLPSIAQRPSEWIAIVMLLVPVIAGAVTWFSSSLRLTETYVALIGSGAVLATALLGYASMRQMALHNAGKFLEPGAFRSPPFVYLAMLFFWIVCYPVHFIVRWRMGGRNLIIPGFLATAAYCAPMAQPFLIDAELPRSDDPGVLSLIKTMVEEEPMMKPVTLREPIEISFDAGMQKRLCRCMVVSNHGQEKLTYQIDWRDRKSGMWQVQLLDRLPLVNAPEVLDLIKNILHDRLWDKGRIRLDPVVIRNPVQTAYDAANQQRIGRASASAGRGDAPITFVITWADPDRKLFNVQVQGKPP